MFDKGQIIANRYKVLDELGRGGMGTVYRVQDMQLNRVAALKVLAPHLVWDNKSAQRFTREAQSAARLQHPNIITIFDVKQESDLHYIVMEFVGGRTLDKVVQEQGLPTPQQVASWLSQIASALDHAHMHNMVHRDVKPANIILRNDGRIVLTDFGIVWNRDATRITTEQNGIGTPFYASPEQIKGQEPTAQSDIYSLGVVVYELLTGGPPFGGDTMAVLYAHVHEPLPALSTARPDLPKPIEKVLEQAMAKDPAKRFASAGALAQAFATACGAPVSAYPYTPPPTPLPAANPVERPTTIWDSSVFGLPPVKQAVKRKSTWLVVAAAALLAILCVAGIIGVAILRGRDTPTKAAGTANLTSSQTVQTPSPQLPTPSATSVPVVGGSQADEKISPPSPAPGQPIIGMFTFAQDVTDGYEPINAAASFAEGITKVHVIFDYSGMSPDYKWERVWYLNGKEISRKTAAWTDPENGRFDYFVDSGSAPLAPGEWSLEIFVQERLVGKGSFTIETKSPKSAQTTNITTTTDTPTPESPTSTPTPKPSSGSGGGVYKLVYSKWDGAQHNVYIANTNGKNERLIIRRAAGPSWSPDGKQIFFFGEQGINQQITAGNGCEFGTISGGIVAIDMPASGDICSAQPGPWPCERKQTDLRALPDDVCEQNGLRVFQNLDWKEGSARWASVAPDGAAVAYDAKPGGDYRIYFKAVLNAAQGKFELIGEQGDWSPDGQKMVYRSGRDNKQGLWISNRDDTGHTNITQNGTDAFPAWSPDGRTIAFSREAEGNIDIYTVKIDGSDLKRLTTAPGPDTLPTYTPGGGIIFRSARDNNNWAIWKMNSDGSGQKEIIPNAGVGPDWSMSRMDVK